MITVVVDMPAESASRHGERLARLLHEQILPAVPAAFLEDLGAIRLKDLPGPGCSPDAPMGEEGGSAGGAVPGRVVLTPADGGFDVDLYAARLIRGGPFRLAGGDVVLGACLAHALLPILVEARERRRHGSAGPEACAVWGERLAQETVSRAYGRTFLFQALEPMLLDATRCTRAGQAALVRVPAAALGRIVQTRFAVVLMVADLVHRTILVHAAPAIDGPLPTVRPLAHEALGILLPGAALLLAVHSVLDLVRGLRSRFRDGLPLGPLFGLAWPAAVALSAAFLPGRLRPSLAGQPLLIAAYLYILLTYLSWGLTVAGAWVAGRPPSGGGGVR